MPIKFNRFVGVVAILISIAGNAGFASAAPRIQPPRASQPQSIKRPALTIPPASSLGVQFLQYATAANTAGDATVIDNPLTNGNMNAIILVTPNLVSGGAGQIRDKHPVGVYYTGAKWAIFNEDKAAMPVGAAFNVLVPTPGANVFVHTAATISGAHTVIDNPLTNANPNAMLLVTANWNPGGAAGIYDPHPIGVFYLGSHWTIFNQDFGGMPQNAAFNVFVLSPGAGVFVHTATAANTDADATDLDNPLTNEQPNALVFITLNFNPGNVGGTKDEHLIGVYNAGAHWAIFNEDEAAMPLGAAFNVLVLVPAFDGFVHTASASNSTSDRTSIDNALTNSNPNAAVFTTHNDSPNGSGPGVAFIHNSGVFYFANQWTIFNQDQTLMPAGAAFNVIIPAPGANVFVHTVRTGSSNRTVIDNPLTDATPIAIVFVTPNYNPGGVTGVLNNHPIGVAYIGSQWTIFNQDGVAMPHNASFNVFVPAPGASVFVHKATVGNISVSTTMIDNPLANGHPNAILLVTPNWNPGGVGGTDENHPIGVSYVAGHWVIYNQDNAAMPLTAAFNVLIYNKLFLPILIRAPRF